MLCAKHTYIIPLSFQTLYYSCNKQIVKFECLLHLCSGRERWAPLFVRDCSAMGDTAIIDCSTLTTDQLLVLLQAVSSEVSKRLKLAEEEVASEAYTVVDPPSTGQSSAPVVSPETGLLQPFRCQFECRWCKSRCTRQEGHKNHSCYEHRHRR